MTSDELDAMREWIRAEIAYGIASNEESPASIRECAPCERDYAENCFQILRNMISN